MTHVARPGASTLRRALLSAAIAIALPTLGAPKKNVRAKETATKSTGGATTSEPDVWRGFESPAAALPTPPPMVTAPAPTPAPTPEEPERGVGLLLGAEAGVVAPLSVLGTGVKAGARAEYHLPRGVPLLLTLGVGYERHSTAAPRLFQPPISGGAVGGYERQAIETQDLLPTELGVLLEPWHDHTNAVVVGASAGLLISWTRVSALGSVSSESGVGAQVAVDAGYTRRLGPVDAFLRLRWALRHTGAGSRSNVIEADWYQSLGCVLGIGVAL